MPSELTGVGRFIKKNGDVFLSGVRYRITFSRGARVDARTFGAGARRSLEGIGEMEGQIFGAAFPHELEGEPVVLELEDGKRWSCFYANGRLVNSGGIT